MICATSIASPPSVPGNRRRHLFSAAVTALLFVGTGGFRAQQQPDAAAPGAAPAAPATRNAAAPADAQAAAVLVTSVEGSARARDNPEANWQIVKQGMRLPQGAEIQTGARSRVFC